MTPSGPRLTALRHYTEEIDGLPTEIGRAALARATVLRGGRDLLPARDRVTACACHLTTLAAALGEVAGRWAGAADPEVRVTLAELADWHLDPGCWYRPRYAFLRRLVPFADLFPVLAASPPEAARAALDAAAVAFAQWCDAGRQPAGEE